MPQLYVLSNLWSMTIFLKVAKFIPLIYYDIFQELLILIHEEGQGIKINNPNTYICKSINITLYKYPESVNAIIKIFAQLGG